MTARTRLARSSALALTLAILGAQNALAETQPAAAKPAEEKVAIRRIFGLETPARDGVMLSSDVWMPEGPGPFPVILVRTPYLKTDGSMHYAKTAAKFAARGYAYVVQDVRGRGDSGGEFGFLPQEAKDSYDAVEAIAAQPWSNGKVCMMGVSYLGSVQWLAAKERPPHLVCLAPTSPGGNIHNEVPSTGGAFMMAWALNWLNGTSGRVSQGANAAGIDMDRVYAHRPLLTMDEAMGRKMRLYRDFLQHDTVDDYWKPATLDAADYAKIDLPVLATTGWFDGDQNGTLMFWDGMHARKDGARDQYLTIGPWLHPQSYFGGAESLNDLTFGKDSIIDNEAMHLAFFDKYLKGSSAPFDQPKVRIYVTGANEWRNFDAWPVPAAKDQRLYLSSGGRANSAAGDGVLGAARPKRGGFDAFTYDPKNPVPLKISGAMFAAARNDVQGRDDVLVYTSPALTETVEVIGSVFVELYASTDARDTDFAVSIQDVQPDGKAVMLGSRPVGILRARYRNGPAAPPQLLTPGKTELYRIELGAIGHAFKPGHRIRIDVTSSASPMFNPNQNTGNPIATDTEWKVARQRVEHTAAYPSAVVLPVVSGRLK